MFGSGLRAVVSRLHLIEDFELDFELNPWPRIASPEFQVASASPADLNPTHGPELQARIQQARRIKSQSASPGGRCVRS